MGIAPLNFGFATFVRVLVPGAVAAVAALPLVAPPLQKALTGLGLAAEFSPIVLISVLTLAFGFLLWSLDDPIYEVIEGRRWPLWLKRAMTARWEEHVRALHERWKVLNKTTPEGRAENSEIWAELRQFPVDDAGEPTALMPTKVGNILAAYEQYPELRYGMDAVFYWPRLALHLDKDVREDIDRQWAPADGWMHMAAALFALGVSYASVGALTVAFPAQLQQACLSWARPEWWPIGLVLIVSSYLPYRLSWAFHIRNGERFKAVFDLHGRDLKAVALMKPAQRRAWSRRWYELQYGVPPKDNPAAVLPAVDPAPSSAHVPDAPTAGGRIRDALRDSRGGSAALIAVFVVSFALGAFGSSARTDAPPGAAFAIAWLLLIGLAVGPALNRVAGLGDRFVTGGHLDVPGFGAVVGTLLAATVLTVLAWFGSEAAGGPLPAWRALTTSLSAAGAEEIIARVLGVGGLLGLLRLAWPSARLSRGGGATVVVIAAVAFAAEHYITGVSPTLPNFVQFVGGGLLLGYLYLAHGLFAVIGAHGLVDFFVYISPLCN